MLETTDKNPAEARASGSFRPLTWTVLTLAIALCINLATAQLSPRVWIDEVMFTDPAFNLASGHGFTSSCWPCQRAGEFFAGNLPLYEVILAGWIRVLGFGIVQVRSLNYVLVSFAIFFTVAGALRRGLMRSSLACVLFSIGVLGGFWTGYSYRGARYDMLGFCLIAACWLTATLRQPLLRYGITFILGIFIPLSSIPPMIALIVIGAIGLAFTRFKELRAYIAAGSGSIVGVASFLGALHHWGLLDAFTRTLPTMMSRSPEFNAKIKSLPHALACDPSTLILTAAAALTLIVAWFCQSGDRTRLLRWLVAALACAIVIPAAFVAAGRFPEYYVWTKHVPTLLCLIVAMVILWRQLQRILRIAAWAIMATVLISAAPFALRLAFAIRAHAARDYAQVEQAESPRLNSHDHAFCSFAYYYPARQTCTEVEVPVSVEWMGPDDWQQISVAVLDADDEPLFFKYQHRDDWSLADTFDPPATRGEASRYAFHVYRRN